MLFKFNCKNQGVRDLDFKVFSFFNPLSANPTKWSNPANICWSSTRLQRNNFTSSKTSWRYLGTRLEDVWKTSRKTKNCYAEDALKTSWRHVLKTYWRHVMKSSWRPVLKTYLEDVLKTYLEDDLKTLWRGTKYLLEI